MVANPDYCDVVGFVLTNTIKSYIWYLDTLVATGW